MYQIVVNKRNDRKKEMIDKIKEMLFASFFGEEWEARLDFSKIYTRAELVATYQKQKREMGHLTVQDINAILNLTIDMEQLLEDGIDFQAGRKELLRQIQLKYEKSETMKNTEKFFSCMVNELTMELYEKITEYKDAEWIFSKQAFLREITAFAWLKICVEEKKEVEQMLFVLEIIFPNRRVDKEQVERTLQSVDDFSEILGTLWIEQAEPFDKVCCWKNEDVDVGLLGQRLVEKAIRTGMEDVLRAQFGAKK